MMDLIEFAKSELNRIYGEEIKEEMNKWMYDHLIHMVSEFSKEGHSGFSASYAANALNKLLRYEPLTPLTGEDDEWNSVGDGMLQNKRCSRVFKYSDGKCFDTEGKVFIDPDGSSYTSRDSHTVVNFPYTPTTEYVQVKS